MGSLHLHDSESELYIPTQLSPVDCLACMCRIIIFFLVFEKTVLLRLQIRFLGFLFARIQSVQKRGGTARAAPSCLGVHIRALCRSPLQTNLDTRGNRKLNKPICNPLSRIRNFEFESVFEKCEDEKRSRVVESAHRSTWQ